MSESPVVIEEQKTPSPEIPQQASQEEIDQELAWLEGKSKHEIAIRLALDRKKLTYAGRDVDTGLYDRRGILLMADQERREAIRENGLVLITIIDLDNLKIINDTEGHDAGDKIILGTAAALKRAVRANDVVGRWTMGDEFIVLSRVNRIEDGKLIKDNITQELGQIKASSGYALWEIGEYFMEAVKRADIAMYKDKKERKTGRG